MKLDGTFLDLSSAVVDQVGCPMPGWRRRIAVHEDRVDISVLASPDVAGIGIGKPDPEIVIYCEPRKMSVDPINRNGWLALDFLEPGHAYWLELRAVGLLISIEREDSDQSALWYQSPADVRRYR